MAEPIIQEENEQQKLTTAARINLLLHNRHFLYCVSIVLFLLLWDFLAFYKITGKFLPRPIEVYRQFEYLTFNTLAG